MDINWPPLLAAIALIVILAAVLWYAARISVPAPEAPAGPPTGAAAMERKVAATVAMLAGMGLLFLGYGLREDDRQVQAQEAQLDTILAALEGLPGVRPAAPGAGRPSI